ncbi:hypothetical protein AB0M43_38155 [Longispora sp. NPDC051575]|uniref:hypothetical protein n=1 Tax=Longispora sp. NPDC051575 TaxID=3154943 RepID=UPI003437A5AB
MTELPDPQTDHDLSHGWLVAVLMHLGGSVDLPVELFQRDVLGPPDGSLYQVLMNTTVVPGKIRFSVISPPIAPRES